MPKRDIQKEFLTEKSVRIIAEIAARRMTKIQYDSSAEIPTVASLVSQTPRAVTFEPSGLLEKPTSRSSRDAICIHSVESLLKELQPDDPPPAPRKQMIHGVFFTGHLLYPGWWMRSPGQVGLASGDWEAFHDRAKSDDPSVRNIRHWLNFGYEQWGPSWDIWNPDGVDQCMFGQIGYGDEANSLTVILAPGAGQKLRASMEGRLAAGVVAKGTLYHDSHNMAGLHENVRQALTLPVITGKEGVSYYFVVSDFEEDGTKSFDFIDIDLEQPSIYSAYMWLCLIRQSDESLGRSGTVILPRTIFIWEHTNLMDRDCLAFNYESLLFKKDYLEKKLGGEKLRLLQHSYSVESVLRETFEKPLIDPAGLSRILNATHDALARGPAVGSSATVLSMEKPKSKKSGRG